MAIGETYEEFVDKFKPKLTTDDCYTPEEVFETMKKYCYEIGWMNDKTSFIRPFYPGGDYEHELPKNGEIVFDNPPFSILSKIIDFYNEHNIKFILFAPALTVMNLANRGVAIAFFRQSIKFENGANVSTCLITNIEHELIYGLGNIYDEKSKKKTIYDPGYMTGAALQSLARKGRYIASYDPKSFKHKTNEGKAYFGGGVEVKILTQNKL